MSAFFGSRANANGNGNEPARKRKVLVVIGTRPGAIKMSPVVRALQQRPEFEVCLCATAQHRELLDQVMMTFGLKPDHDLDIMTHGQSLTGIARSVMKGVEEVIHQERPEWVLVQGDTTTSMSASLAAFHEGVRLGHVEAGLRTQQIHSPFPEEGNRRISAAVSEIHFAPTEWAAENLRREGISSDAVVVTGNTVIDAMHQIAQRPFDHEAAGLGHLAPDGQRLILVTAHRRENLGEPMDQICQGLRAAAERHPDAHFACPVHLNPKARTPFFRILSGLNNVSLLPPLDYPSLVWILNKCHFVVTDSGGLQEEAAGLGKPVLVMREWTERPEGVHAGIARLIGTESEHVYGSIDALLSSDGSHRMMACSDSIYGDGNAAPRIAAALVDHSAMPPDREVVHMEAMSASLGMDLLTRRFRRSPSGEDAPAPDRSSP
jgi:UDP-N-acetylglucosamine 2-epimerase